MQRKHQVVIFRKFDLILLSNKQENILQGYPVWDENNSTVNSLDLNDTHYVSDYDNNIFLILDYFYLCGFRRQSSSEILISWTSKISQIL